MQYQPPHSSIAIYERVNPLEPRVVKSRMLDWVPFPDGSCGLTPLLELGRYRCRQSYVYTSDRDACLSPITRSVVGSWRLDRPG